MNNLNLRKTLKAVVMAVLVLTVSNSVFAQFPGRTPTPGDTLQSTRVLANGDVVLSIYAPEAETVSAAGDIVSFGADIDVKKDPSGVWSITLPNVKPGTYRYNFVVDGVNVYDPKAANAFETKALIDVLPNGDEFFSMREDIPHGAVSEIYYYSNTTESMRRMHVWTPAGYNLGNETLPVMYLIHGGGDSDVAWPNVGRAGLILDNLLADGKCEKMIVVMPDGGIDTKVFAQDLGNDIMPYIESNYKVKKGANNTALAGLSMGGLETMDSYMAFPDRFAYINVMSSGWFTTDTEMYEKGEARLREIEPTLKKTVKYLIFTQGGPEDIAYENCKQMLTIYDKLGFDYDYSEMPGGHSWYVWRHDLYNFAQKCFK